MAKTEASGLQERPVTSSVRKRPLHRFGLQAGQPIIDREQRLPLTIDVVVDERGFHALRARWDDLVDNSSATIFQTFDWLHLWWKHFGCGDGREPHILIVRSDARIVGIAPFFVQHYSIGSAFLLRKLRLMGCGVPHDRTTYEHFAEYAPSDFLDVIVATGYESVVADRIASYLNNSVDHFAEIDMTNIPEDGVIFTQILPRLDAHRFQRLNSRPEKCPLLTVPASLQDFLDSLRPNNRRRVQQARTAFSDGALAAIEPVTENHNEALQELIGLHQKRWNSLGFPGVFSDARFRAFQVELVNRLLEQGKLWFKIAKYNGSTIASRLAYLHHGRAYDYLGGFDHTLAGARRRPGLALVVSLIEDACQSGIQVIEFLRGAESYKSELTAEENRVWRVTIRSRSLGGSIVVRFAFTLMKLNSILSMIKKELFLLKVHYKYNGPILFLYFYCRFFLRRMWQALSHFAGGASG